MELITVRQPKTKLNEPNSIEIGLIELEIKICPLVVKHGIKTVKQSKSKLYETNPIKIGPIEHKIKMCSLGGEMWNEKLQDN